MSESKWVQRTSVWATAAGREHSMSVVVEARAGVWVVHAAVKESRGGFTVTHEPTGRMVLYYEPIEQCRALLEALEDCGLDQWGSEYLFGMMPPADALRPVARVVALFRPDVPPHLLTASPATEIV